MRRICAASARPSEEEGAFRARRIEVRIGSAVLSKGDGRHAEVLHDAAGEVGRGREREVLRNPPHGDVLLEKQPRDLARGEEVDEVTGTAPAHPAADFREIFGRDEEFLCVPGEVPVLSKGPNGVGLGQRRRALRRGGLRKRAVQRTSRPRRRRAGGPPFGFA